MDSSEQDLMASFEEDSHAFVIRLWAEGRDKARGTAEWRGWVEHVRDGQRHYFRDVSEISRIVASHLNQQTGP